MKIEPHTFHINQFKQVLGLINSEILAVLDSVHLQRCVSVESSVLAVTKNLHTPWSRTYSPNLCNPKSTWLFHRFLQLSNRYTQIHSVPVNVGHVLTAPSFISYLICSPHLLSMTSLSLTCAGGTNNPDGRREPTFHLHLL